MREFRVLGPIEVRRDGQAVRLNGRKARSLLAAFVLRGDHIVLTDRLVEVLWGERPPLTAVAQVHKYVSGLRSALGQERIVRHGHGYRLCLEDDQLDLLMFDRGVSAARAARASGRRADAARELRAALGLWRGVPLADTTDALQRAEVPALEERRIGALLEMVEAELSLGRHKELVGELAALVTANPLHEQLRGHLMLALYRCGRVAEALAVYQEGRTLLAEELGIEPGAELQRLHQAVLVMDPALSADVGTAEDAEPVTLARGGQAGQHSQDSADGDAVPPPAPLRPVPAQLPPSIADFTGRGEEVDRICTALRAAHEDAPALVAIAGKGGVGKTTLAVHAARRVGPDFPDGQLYVRLRDAQARPVEPKVALQGFLRAMGVDDPGIPDSLDECTRLFRSRSATRRMLVVLDDATDEAQIRPLLPSSPDCAVLITGRTRLCGLEAAHHVHLEVFDSSDAVELFKRIAGANLPRDDQASTREITQLCGHLPLAVRIAAARFAQHSRGDLAWFARRLTDERRRLDILVAGDLEVRANLEVSYQGLGARERQAFCLLGLVDTTDFAAWVLAPLLDTTVDEAEDIVEELVNAQLLDIVDSDVGGHTRYRYHDLVRLYARERAESEYTEPERRAAFGRLLSFWVHLATEAGHRLYGTSEHGRAHQLSAGPRHAFPAAPCDVDWILRFPLEWFETERPALTAAIVEASARGFGSLAWALADSITDHIELCHRYDDWEHTHTRALEACRREDDAAGAGVMLLRLAGLYLIRTDAAASLRAAERAEEALEDSGHKAVIAEALVAQAAALRVLGDHDRALDRVRRALDMARATSNLLAAARGTRELGTIHYERARWEEAARALRESLALSRALRNQREQALAMRYLAVVLRHQESFEEACAYAQAARAMFQHLRDQPYVAFTSLTLGLTLIQLRDPSARRVVEEGVALLEEMDLGFGTAEALYVRAALELAHHRGDRAVEQLVQAIRLLGARPVHNVLLSTVELLGQALEATGDRSRAAAARCAVTTLTHLVGEPPPPGLLASLTSPPGRKTEEPGPTVSRASRPLRTTFARQGKTDEEDHHPHQPPREGAVPGQRHDRHLPPAG
ncbi:tetratricopeptide repeat protein [Streptomyces durbertensis]|uniref:Tetratricopeptide repeat protein n=1 Tax=Streptomyces durbertensis TaxID=2448886 RepID=A0ABR6EIK5_9ACTN|nr:AfsR/SARP family transcriptional regulator [Streptomyces durbertensis]MBB1245156.1 tetratricopeptide repeat protein [Streptomyces durbertensis]